jgi:hypothetical protein
MPHRNTEVTLNPQEQAVCLALAKSRYANNRKAGTRNAKRGPHSNKQIDLEGISAEFAFAKLFNIFPDFSIVPRTADSDSGDCKLQYGRAVDVKATQYRTGKLISVPWKKPTVDLFALMTGVFPTYTFRGRRIISFGGPTSPSNYM